MVAVKERQKVSVGALFALHAEMADERRRWRVAKAVDSTAYAVREGTEEFTKFPFKDDHQALSFIQMKCLAAGLKTLGLDVEPLD